MLTPERKKALALLSAQLGSAKAAASTRSVSSTGIELLDAILGGGIKPGSLVTLEGKPGSGTSAVLARLLATATADGMAALLEQPQGEFGRFDPASLTASGVRLSRLCIFHCTEASSFARACDVLIRSNIFSVVATPMLRVSDTIWTRLTKLLHQHACMLIVTGCDANSELRSSAAIRLQCSLERVRWHRKASVSPLTHVRGMEVHVRVLKHKFAAPGGTARLQFLHESEHESMASQTDTPVLRDEARRRYG